jgi:lipopolysaccharide/colanic/teichoic acid biosynthesis glycosyltransferase
MKYSTYKLFKRFFDVLFASIALIFLIPVLILIIIIMFLCGYKTYFFSQKRVGYREKVFNLFKLKSMTDARNENGELLSDEKKECVEKRER